MRNETLPRPFDGRRTAEAIEKNRKHYEFWDDENHCSTQSFSSSSWNGYIDCNIVGDPGFVKIIDKGTINILSMMEILYRTVEIFLKTQMWVCFYNFDGESQNKN